jgi:hypothetical protein
VTLTCFEGMASAIHPVRNTAAPKVHTEAGHVIELHLCAKRKLGKARASLASAALAVLFTPAITIRSLSMARALGIWCSVPRCFVEAESGR